MAKRPDYEPIFAAVRSTHTSDGRNVTVAKQTFQDQANPDPDTFSRFNLQLREPGDAQVEVNLSEETARELKKILGSFGL